MLVIYFSFVNREEIKRLDNVCLIDLSLLTEGGFCQLPQNDPTHR